MADVVLDLGTSIAFEAVIRNCPVLSLEHVHANHSTIPFYIPETDIRCRDDLYGRLQDLHARSIGDFYSSESRERFIREVIAPNGDEVLDDYSRFLLSC